MRVLFIGSNPSAKNTYKQVPFLGTKSFDVLCDWTDKMELRKYFSVENISVINLIDEIKPRLNKKDIEAGCDRIRYVLRYRPATHIIALGKNAEKACKILKLKYFSLPHPGGSNRLLNDKKFVDNILKECQQYIIDVRDMKEWIVENM